MEAIIMDFQTRLLELRKGAGLSQEALAELLNVTRQAVQKWESGASKPDLDNLTALADYFQVSLDYLVTGREPVLPAAEQPTIVNNYYQRAAYEYKSRRTLLGLPLIHINYGIGFHRAKGIIAIGNIATGFIAIGSLSVGLLSLGGVSLGLLLSLGGLALGGVSVGGGAVGLLAMGGGAAGLFAYGGLAYGAYAAGGVAVGTKAAIGGVASAPLAIGAAADGVQAFQIPADGLSPDQLAAARDALTAACQGAPRWFAKLMLFFLNHNI